jgi:hypothetical protein
VNIINGLMEGARDRWEGREAEAYLLGVRENIHLGWVGCIARQTEYGFGVMNESYVFTFTRCIKPMAFCILLLRRSSVYFFPYFCISWLCCSSEPLRVFLKAHFLQHQRFYSKCITEPIGYYGTASMTHTSKSYEKSVV